MRARRGRLAEFNILTQNAKEQQQQQQQTLQEKSLNSNTKIIENELKKSKSFW